MTDFVAKGEEPMNRGTMLGSDTMDFIEAHDLYRDDDRVIILIMESKGEVEVGGITIGGYNGTNSNPHDTPEDTRRVVEDLLAHLQAVAESSGIGIGITRVPRKDRGEHN